MELKEFLTFLVKKTTQHVQKFDHPLNLSSSPCLSNFHTLKTQHYSRFLSLILPRSSGFMSQIPSSIHQRKLFTPFTEIKENKKGTRHNNRISLKSAYETFKKSLTCNNLLFMTIYKLSSLFCS